MFGRQWNIGAMGGLIGWNGYESALQLLLHGYQLDGVELLTEMERLRFFEEAQLEIEVKRREYEKKKKKKKSSADDEDGPDEGDLSDFEFEDSEDEP